MKKLLVVALLAVTSSAHAGIAFLKHDYVSGMNRICVYNDLGSDVHRTIKATELCPLSINT